MIRRSLVLLLLITQPVFAALTATVDRTRITELDLVTLAIRLDDARAMDTFDLSAIEKDFDVVAQSGPNVSSRIQISGGQQINESYTEWRLALRPKRIGRLIIPRVTIGSESTDPIAIEVVAASENLKKQVSQFAFFDTEVDATTTYVQGEVIYTVRLFYDNSVSGDFPAPPAISSAVIEPLGAEKRYTSIVNNRRYGVLERRYAIYPQKSGTLVIPREAFAGRRGNRLFSSRSERINAVSKQHTVEVRPRPATFSGDTWLPARNIELTGTWSESPPGFTVGEPVNLTLSLRAEGLPATSLPRFDELGLDGARTYQDPPQENSTPTETGMLSSLTVTTGIVPTSEGTITIPAIEIPWWNTRTDREEVARLPAQTFRVRPAATLETALPVAPSAAPAGEAAVAPAVTSAWQYLAIVLAALWLITLYFLWQARRRFSLHPQPAPETPAIQASDEHDAFEALKRACRANDATGARNALFFWAKARYPMVNSLSELTRRTGSDDLASEISGLEDALYAPDAKADWRGQRLLQQVTALRNEAPPKNPARSLVGTLNPT